MPTSTARVADDEPGGTPDEDDAFCVPAEDSLLIKINGCFFDDEDFDGPSYQNDWPGTNPNPNRTPSSIRRRCCSPAR